MELKRLLTQPLPMLDTHLKPIVLFYMRRDKVKLAHSDLNILLIPDHHKREVQAILPVPYWL